MRDLTRQDAVRRIDRIVGQGRGLRGMVEEGRECGDVLIQIQSIKGALDGLEALLLVEHIDGCVYAGGPGGACSVAPTPEARLKALQEIVRRHIGSR